MKRRTMMGRVGGFRMPRSTYAKPFRDVWVTEVSQDDERSYVLTLECGHTVRRYRARGFFRGWYPSPNRVRCELCGTSPGFCATPIRQACTRR